MKETIQKLDMAIPGLEWIKNYCAETGNDSYTLVANPGPRISDFHQWYHDSYEAFVVHASQIDRYTFFGNPEQLIMAEFVDCRDGSETFQETTSIKFSPDPTYCLVIPAGVAVRITGLRNIAIRSEPILLAPVEGSPYSPGNDQIRISTATLLDEFPAIKCGHTPLPSEALQIINKRQQDILSKGLPYTTSFGVPNGDSIVRLNVEKSSK